MKTGKFAALSSPALMLAAVLLVLPGRAGAAMPAAEASAAADSATLMAEGNAKRLADFPEEFIPLVIMYPYGSEEAFLKDAGGTVSELSEGLARRAAYWEAVRDTLRTEKRRAERELRDATPETIGGRIKADRKLGLQLQAAQAIAKDIDMDAALVKTIDQERHPEDPDQLYARKDSLFQKLKKLRQP